MRDLIKKVPIPVAGVALGIAALGNLLQPYAGIVYIACGIVSAILVALLIAKIVLFPAMIRDDLRNSILASVSATLFMSLMQLATYLASFAYAPALVLWAIAIAAHLALMVGFSVRFFAHFKLHEVFPTYFICYVGIIVASATSPVFGMEAFGHVLFWVGFSFYLVLLALVTYRYVKHDVPEPARPLFCIYTAPMSLSLVGYLATASDPNPLFVGAMLVMAQLLYLIVLSRLPKFLRLKFYPSFAAMTFPFVITATAFGQAVAFLNTVGAVLPAAFDVLFIAETAIAVAMVSYVLGHYVRFFIRRIELPQSEPVARESKLAARFAEDFEN